MVKQSFNIKKEFSSQYFWDVDTSSLDVKASKRLIIERIFTLGTIEEMKKVITLYGRSEVIKVLCKANYLDPKTLNFVSFFFNISKNDFRCYTSNQSDLQHWSS